MQAYEQRTSGRGYQPRSQPTRRNTAPASNLTPTDVGNQIKNFFSGASAKISGGTNNFGRGGAGNNPQGSQPGPPVNYQQQFNEVE